MNPSKFLARALLPLTLAVVACGPQVKEEEEVQTFERRRPACEVFCELVLDPECGSEEDGIYEDVDHCIDYCISAEARFWFLQEDGTDACANEFTEHYACAAEASCEERWIITNVPARAAETPCLGTSEAYGECQLANQGE